MKSISVWFRKHLMGLIHPKVRSFILRRFSLLEQRTEWWRSKDPYLNDPPYSTYEPKYPVRLGIIEETWRFHSPYIAACRDMDVAYRLVDISGSDWIETVRNSDCDAFLVYPSIQLSVWREMYDERLRVMVDELGKTIYPFYDALWLYENKKRLAYWLKANNIPHPKTWVFYDKLQALDFAKGTSLPIVSKTSKGARASGVTIHRNRNGLVKYIKKAFKNGILHGDGEAKDAEWGFVILQEYLPDVKEWRMIRIGNSFFGHKKGRKGDFHSGTLLKEWGRPPKELLELVYRITEEHRFRSMALDIFEDAEGRFCINELQALFGASLPYQMKIGDRIGRMVRDEQGDWIFDEGDFCKNKCFNLRVKDVLDNLINRNMAT